MNNATVSFLAGASVWTRWAALSWVLSLLGTLAACTSPPPVPDWQLNAKSSIERATEAGLRGDSRIEMAEFARARAEVARTGQPAVMARLELLRCATRVMIAGASGSVARIARPPAVSGAAR